VFLGFGIGTFCMDIKSVWKHMKFLLFAYSAAICSGFSFLVVVVVVVCCRYKWHIH